MVTAEELAKTVDIKILKKAVSMAKKAKIISKLSLLGKKLSSIGIKPISIDENSLTYNNCCIYYDPVYKDYCIRLGEQTMESSDVDIFLFSAIVGFLTNPDLCQEFSSESKSARNG